jgi:hypothetical protein
MNRLKGIWQWDVTALGKKRLLPDKIGCDAHSVFTDTLFQDEPHLVTPRFFTA